MYKPNLLSVIVADDQALFRKAIVRVVKQIPAIHTVYEASHGEEVMDRLTNNTVDLLLLDLQMPIVDGFETCKRIADLDLNVRIILLSMLVDGGNNDSLLKTGAHAFLSKDIDIDELEKTIYGVTHDILEERSYDKNFQYPFNLSERELEVLILVKQGLTSKEIAEKLYINKRTVDSRRDCLYKKIGAKNSSEAIFIANKIFGNQNYFS